MALETKVGACPELIKAADELRQIVFIDEQGVLEEEIFDGLNNQAVHVVVFDRNAPVATARILNDGDIYRIGLVAVSKSRRGERLGVKVMQVAIQHIATNGGKEVLLTAQQEVRGFYEKFGFVQCGEAETFESGFVLVPMKLNL